jgi:hypothetical protein
MKQAAIDIIRKTDSLNFTVSCLQQLEQRLRDKTLMLGGNPGLEHFLSELSVDRLGPHAVSMHWDVCSMYFVLSILVENISVAEFAW